MYLNKNEIIKEIAILINQELYNNNEISTYLYKKCEENLLKG